MFGITLAALPRKAKWLITLVLISFLLNHLFAVLLVREVTTQIDKSAREHFSFKSFAILLRMAHQHAFGHGVMYFLTSAFFLLAEASEALAIGLMTALFAASWFDILSWFLLKFRTGRWELLSEASGTTYAVVFFVMTGTILYQMWRPRRATGGT
jgi:hypothetical protein